MVFVALRITDAATSSFHSAGSELGRSKVGEGVKAGGYFESARNNDNRGPLPNTVACTIVPHLSLVWTIFSLRAAVLSVEDTSRGSNPGRSYLSVLNEIPPRTERRNSIPLSRRRPSTGRNFCFQVNEKNPADCHCFNSGAGKSLKIA